METDNDFFLIVNPSAGSGKSKKASESVLRHFTSLKISFDSAISADKTDFHDVIVRAIQNGHRTIVVLGGDGSLNIAVNACMQFEENIRSRLKLGIIPLGTGNDWIKTHYSAKDLDDCIKIILRKKTIKHDIGLISHNNQKMYFVNIASVGFSGFLINKMAVFKKFGSIGYLLGLLFGAVFFKPQTLEITINEKSISANTFILSVGIGKFAGGGLMLCPSASPTDNYFHITLVRALNLFELIKNISALKNGSFIHHEKVSEYIAKRVSVYPINKEESAECEADGEYCGAGAFEFEIIPGAIQIIV